MVAPSVVMIMAAWGAHDVSRLHALAASQRADVALSRHRSAIAIRRCVSLTLQGKERDGSGGVSAGAALLERAPCGPPGQALHRHMHTPDCNQKPAALPVVVYTQAEDETAERIAALARHIVSR